MARIAVAISASPLPQVQSATFPQRTSVLTFPTLIEGGSGINVVPDWCAAYGDARLLPGMSVQQVTQVIVSLQSPDGQVVDSGSVTIPAAVGDGRDHRPPLAFDVELAVPTILATVVLVVQAQAFNAEDGLIASTRVRLEAEM